MGVLLGPTVANGRGESATMGAIVLADGGAIDWVLCTVALRLCSMLAEECNRGGSDGTENNGMCINEAGTGIRPLLMLDPPAIVPVAELLVDQVGLESAGGSGGKAAWVAAVTVGRWV